MGGTKQSSTKLNLTLVKIINILRENKINDWFISYGTLLGITREDSCIDGDDDVDIVININLKDKILDILRNENYEFQIIESNLIKTLVGEIYSSIDFYFSHVDKNGNFNVTWEGMTWSECYLDKEKKNFITKKWKDIELNIPKNAELKLERRYGENWRIPEDWKGPQVRVGLVL